MSRGTADSRATANSENAREVRAAFEAYLSSLRKQWFATVRDWRTYPRSEQPPEVIAEMRRAGIEWKPRFGGSFFRPADLMDIVTADEEFRYSQTEFRRMRRMLRNSGLEKVADELQDLRNERAEALYKWIFIQQRYFIQFPYSLDISTLDVREQQTFYIQMGVMQDGITKYLSCLEEEEAIIKDTLGGEALANLRGWKSATGADIAGLKPEIERGANAAEGAEKVAKESKSLLDRIIGFFKAHILPKTSNCAVTQKALSNILEKFNAKVTERQIKRWEQFIKTGGRKGTKPPDGYTLETRKTLAGATTWARNYADLEAGVLNAKISLEKRFGKNL